MSKFELLCQLKAISSYAYDIHYSAEGKNFYSDHIFSERLADVDVEDDYIETMYLGESEDAPSSIEINEQVASMTPEVTPDTQINFKALRDMIVSALMMIQNYDYKTKAEEDLLGSVAHILQRHNGLLFRQLRYTNEEIRNSDDDIDYWFSTKTGAHIPVKKGQSREDAMKAFVKKRKSKDEEIEERLDELEEEIEQAKHKLRNLPPARREEEKNLKQEIKDLNAVYDATVKRLSKGDELDKLVKKEKKTIKQVSKEADKLTKYGANIHPDARPENIDIINKTVSETFSKYGQKDGLSGYGTNYSMSDGQYMRSSKAILEFNQEIAEGDDKFQEKLFKEYVSDRKNILQDKMNNLNKKMEQTSDTKEKKKIKQEIEKVKESLKYNRWSAHTAKENFIRDTILHETGHIFMDRASQNADVERDVKQAYEKAKESGDIYKISEYASTDMYEFFAEAFLMNETGQEMPDYVKNMVKAVTRQMKH